MPPLHLLHRAAHRLLGWVDHVGEVRPGTPTAAAFGSMGDAACIDFPHATLLNTGSVHIGTGTLIGRQATLAVGYASDDTNLPERALVIGDRCVFGARVTITAHQSIEIGDDVFCGQGVFITDASHGYSDPTMPIGHQFAAPDPVVVGSGSWIGHGAMLLPGARLGRQVAVAAGSIVRGPVGDHTVVAGNPARPIRWLEPGVGWVNGDGEVRPVHSGDLLAREQ